MSADANHPIALQVSKFSSRYPHLGQPCLQVFLGPVPLDPVAVRTEQLQVLDMVIIAAHAEQRSTSTQ